MTLNALQVLRIEVCSSGALLIALVVPVNEALSAHCASIWRCARGTFGRTFMTLFKQDIVGCCVRDVRVKPI